jgi:hypothetical protein
VWLVWLVWLPQLAQAWRKVPQTKSATAQRR